MNDATTRRPLDLRYFLTVAVVAVVYFAAAKFGLSLAFGTKQVTAVWPPTGIALAALLLFGYRIAPGILLAAFVANVLANEPAATAAGIAIGNTLEGLAGAFLVRRFVGFDPSIEKVRNVLGLVGLAAFLSTTVSASIGVASLCFSHLVPWSAYGSVWSVWWVGDAMGDVVIAPFLLAWAMRPRVEWRGYRLLEFAALFVLLIGVSQIVFSGILVKSAPLSRLDFAVFPFLIWAALRFSPRETVSAALVISAVALWWTIHDEGPFALGTLDERLVQLDTFVAVIGVTALILGAATAEREHSQRRLREEHDLLEARVAARTAKLKGAVMNLLDVNETLHWRTTDLAKKSAEVEAFVYSVSHDLRAPLVNLQGFSRELEASCRALDSHLRAFALPPTVETAVRPLLADEIPTAMRFIGGSATKLQRLLDALLALSRSGRQEYAWEEVDVRAIVDATVDFLRLTIEKSGATVSVHTLPPAWGDATAIGQVFANLIGNALKYLQPGRVGLIEVGGETRDGMVHYWVRDNGSGIPASAQPRLFQVFQRFHPELAAGEGIGLATVKRVVERHGGRISAESEVGTGTTFHLSLPVVGAREA